MSYCLVLVAFCPRQWREPRLDEFFMQGVPGRSLRCTITFSSRFCVILSLLSPFRLFPIYFPRQGAVSMACSSLPVSKRLSNAYWHCPHICGAGSMHLSCVRPSVRSIMGHGSEVCCCGPAGRRRRSIAARRKGARRAASECGQCHDVSVRSG